MNEHQKVVGALREAGVHADSLWELVNSRESYASAIPGLIELLPMVQDRKIKQGIVRALSMPESKGIAAAPLIMEMYASRGDETLAWAIGNALSLVVTSRDKAFDDLVALMRDESLGRGRQGLKCL